MRSSLSLAFAALLLVSLAVPAADAASMDEVSWYALGELSLPFGDFGDLAGLGFGPGIGASLPFDEKLAFRGELAYLWFGGESIGDLDYSVSMLPIVFLAEYQFVPDSPFYGLGGLGFFRVTIDVEGESFGFSFDQSASDTEIGLVAGGGYRIDEKWALEGRLNLISDANQLTVNGTYTF